MTEYYNVLESGIKVVRFASNGLLMVLIGVIVIIMIRKFKIKLINIKFAYIWTGLVALLTTTAFISTGSEYLKYRRAINEDKYQEEEGIVENFNPMMPSKGNKDESFTVNGVLFKYSDNIASAGFNNSKYYGGPIDSGKYVRIRYYEGKILQLWIKE